MSRTRLSTYTAPPAEVTRALDALRAQYEVPTAFPPEALTEAESAASAWAQDGPARLLADGARDARDLDLVTIDPLGSMDLDQAVLLERLPVRTETASATDPAAASATGTASTGHAPEPPIAYRVHYAIASLATFVIPGGALDTELRRAARPSTPPTPPRPCTPRSSPTAPRPSWRTWTARPACGPSTSTPEARSSPPASEGPRALTGPPHLRTGPGRHQR